MFRSLRLRLALSHAIPVLLFVALLGTLLLYQLERTYFLDSLAAELAGQGAIIASFLREEPQIWSDPVLAQFAVEQLQERINAQIMLLDSRGRIIAASWFETTPAIGSRVESSVVFAALQGQSVWSINNNVILQGQVLDVAVPVNLDSRRVLGVVRLSHNLTEIHRRLAPLRSLVWLMLGVGAILSLLLGLALAQSVAAPLRRLAEVVGRFRPTAPLERVPEVGPSEIRTVAASFNQMGARLVELEGSRRALLTGIVHELSRPLGAIKAAAQTIHKNPEPELARELAAGIDGQIEQLRLQVEDLALLSELEYQGLRINFEPVDIAELVDQQCRQLLPTAGDRGIALSWATGASLPLISGDAKRIALIVDNLIHNALKYTPSGGLVRVDTYSEAVNGELQVVISVSDNGPGIARAEQERIFQLFYRSPAQLRRHQGMGIGLSLARQLAEAHGGTLSVQSTEGEGSTFIVRLPLAPPAARLYNGSVVGPEK
jgi:signal transduction histidine kinase